MSEPKEGEAVEYCYSDCKFDRKHSAKSKMLRCLLCMVWVHIKCDKEADDDVNGFTCASCRKLAGHVTNILSALATTVLKLDSMSKALALVDNNQARLIRDIEEIKTKNASWPTL